MANSDSIRWDWRTFDSLSAHELYAVLAAREAVFVVEQNCAYQEADGFDDRAMHLIGWDSNVVAAYLRVLPPGAKYAEPAIGRVLTAKAHRGSGAGQAAMRNAVTYIDRVFPGLGTRISAQAHLEQFYRGFGFTCASEGYLEDGIPHIEMLRA